MSPPSPCVSVIIIVFNGEEFLQQAIVSVISQTFVDWELLIVDDGSMDGSANIAQRYADQDPRIQVLFHSDRKNHGMSAARNLGLAHARGEFVGFLDADDVWMPEKLAEQISILKAQPSAGMVYGRTLIWSSWADGEGSDFYYDLGLPPNKIYEPPILFHVLLANKSQTPTTCNALIRGSLTRQVGGFGEAFTGMFEDQVFFSKVLLRAPTFLSDRTWAKYRRHSSSCSAQSAAAGEDEKARLAFLKWLNAYAARENVQIGTRLRIWREVTRCGKKVIANRLRRSLSNRILP
ncbi:glycosyltransferase family 2 protein [Microvirga sp. BSC39]|uniref:glycosyltransferase family 2 protein n=1 Tax=Microvirga sp. BSC39 TaxID=1549810 RepID=UPI000690396E|nr:glycosyltransferase family 2 protein [Microvirga sp. BSC39]